MSKARFLLFLSILLCILLSSSLSPVSAQPDNETPSYAPADTVFIDINLAEDGVRAVDSSGYDWYYDFEQGRFVVGVLPAGGGFDGPDEGEYSTVYLPVEERCTLEKTVKAYTYGNVRIGEDEYVKGSVKASGQVTVRGWVQGDVVSNDRILVKNGGRVDGDMVAPEIIVQDGGVVLGDQVIADVDIDFSELREAFSVSGVIVITSLTGLFLFCGFLVVTLMPRQIKNFSECIAANTVKAYAIGFLLLPAIAVVMLLLVITIVGVILLPLVPLVYVAAAIIGIISLGGRVGRAVSLRLFGGEQSMILQTMLGIAVSMVPWFVVALLLGSTNSTAEVFGWILLGLVIAASTYPVCTGIGAAYLSRFGFRAYGGPGERRVRPTMGPAPAPAPPPIPTAPPEPRPRSYRDKGDETSDSNLRKEL